jgi:hypothetical protein
LINIQALYVIKFGNIDSIIRIRYTGSVNNPPVPSIAISNNGGAESDSQQNLILVGSIIQFDGSGSKDDANDTLTYRWTFGDGGNSTKVAPSHVYSEPGEYRVVLVVTDKSGQAQQDSITVMVGKPPTATIINPADGDDFDVGQVLRLQGLAYDHNSNRIPDDKISWEVRLHHAGEFCLLWE